MQTTTAILEQNFKLNPEGWIHLVAKGDHLWRSPDGKEEILQRIDDPALEAMRNRFAELGQAGRMLIDYDHQSHNASKRTTAAGWIEELDIRPDGLWGLPRWSAQGYADVAGGSYRFISPTFSREASEWLDQKTMRPLQLIDVALTNRPNIPNMLPLTNPESVQAQKERDKIKELQAEYLQLQNHIQALQAQLVERDLDRHRIPEEARPHWRPLLLSNRSDCLKALAQLSAVKSSGLLARPRVGNQANTTDNLHNRSKAKPPELNLSLERPLAAAQRDLVEHLQLTNRCSYQDAWDQARRQRPDLFHRQT